MKNLLAIALVLLVAGFTMAQSHVDVIQQVGSDNTGIVIQSGAQSNDGKIYTTGNNNDAATYQDNNGFGGGGLTALTTQNGDHNHGLIDQAHFRLAIPGSTFGHEGTIDQDGYWNTADIYQFNGQPSTAYIRQLGNSNDGDQLIYSDGQGNSSASIWQQGNNNIGYQNLGFEAFVGASSFELQQLGSNNTSYQIIYSNELFPLGGSSTTLNNHGVVYTNGNHNYALQDMNYNGSGDNFDNTATITQYNDWNSAIQHQTGTGHTSTIYQNGNSNIATSIQN